MEVMVRPASGQAEWVEQDGTSEEAPVHLSLDALAAGELIDALPGLPVMSREPPAMPPGLHLVVKEPKEGLPSLRLATGTQAQGYPPGLSIGSVVDFLSRWFNVGGGRGVPTRGEVLPGTWNQGMRLATL